MRYDVALTKSKVYKETKPNYFEWVLVIIFGIRRKDINGNIIDTNSIYTDRVEIIKAEFEKDKVKATAKIKDMIKQKIKDFEAKQKEIEHYEATT